MENTQKQRKRDQEQKTGKRRYASGKPNKPSRPSKGSEKLKRPTGAGGTGTRPSSPASKRGNTSPGSRRSTRRIRPATRAVNRQTKNVLRPMPQPPARRPLASKPVAKTQTLSEELRLTVARVESEFERLEKQSQLSTIYDAIGSFDSRLVEYPLTVDALRDRGYVHSGQLEDQLEALDDKWDGVRSRVESALRQQVQRLDSELDVVERKVKRMTTVAAVKEGETAVNSLSRRISAAESAVEGLYQGLENELNTIGYRLTAISRMLDRYEESPEIRLYEAEGPLLAVEAEWQQDGDEGPEGFLFLTDQRLAFEQREEVVTKRKFGIFKSESEKIQKVLIEVQTHEIEQIVHKEEGGFLGMGKDDILELIFADTASLTRARFHLKGQDSSEWAAMLKRVQTGEIDDDRADDYMEEVEVAEAVTASFPTQCPNCYAAVQPPPRGATSLTCEFCGTVIIPIP